MKLEAIAIGHRPPDDVNAIIEVPIGGEPIKYEMDKDAGALVVDRFLYTPMRYPGNYGFVPHTCPTTATRSTCWSPTPVRSSPAP
jgi:Inorganic pyrophosphatase